MDSHIPQQRNVKASIKQGQDDACINPVDSDKVRRSANMAAIHGKNTKPEMVVRHWLWEHGFRYRLNHSRLPGKPDIVMRKYRTCIFVNGCFWHGHNVSFTPNPSPKGERCKEIENSECCKIPKTNREFWVAKIQRIKSEMFRCSMSWHQWVGTASPFGNVN